MTEQTNPTGNTQIVVLNRDLFFGVRIGNLLKGAGYAVSFTPDTATFGERLRDIQPAPVLGIVDMSAGIAWDAIRDLMADASVSTPVLVFGAHKDVDGFRAAKAAGVTRVVSNGDFHRDTIALVQRYALS